LLQGKTKQKIGSEAKICLKQNKTKKRCFNFALVGSEKFEVKRSKIIFFRVIVINGSGETHAKKIFNSFALFRFEAKFFFFFCENGAPFS
jgi:hypothetical protein